ncbi:MAG: orotate phosphoribosyltransferase [Clostridia bacterium]|nr:orotate phosphoribosyltransferase [Clostridia bacterium]
MLTREKVIEILTEAGVLQTGHFCLTSGRHSANYMQCAKIFQYTKYAEPLCAALAEKFDHIDVVIGPAIGAIQMAYEVSRQLKTKNVFAERKDGVMTLRRGFTIEKGQRVLVVEDVVTTGGSVREVMDIVKSCGGDVVGVGAIVDRTGGKIDFGVPFSAVLSMDIESFEAEECPLCKKGLPIDKPGSRNA